MQGILPLVCPYSDYTYMICCICSSSSSSGGSISANSSRFEGGVYLRCRLQNKRGSCSDSAYQCEARRAAVRSSRDAACALRVADHAHQLVQHVVAAGSKGIRVNPKDRYT